MPQNNDEIVYKARFKNVGTEISSYIFVSESEKSVLNLFKIHRQMEKINDYGNKYRYKSINFDGKSESTVKQVINVLQLLGFISDSSISFEKGNTKNLIISFTMDQNTNAEITKWKILVDEIGMRGEKSHSLMEIHSLMITYIINTLVMTKMDTINNMIENFEELEREDKEFINLICSIYFIWSIENLNAEDKVIKTDHRKYDYLCRLTFASVSEKTNTARWEMSYKKFVEIIIRASNLSGVMRNTLFPMISEYFADENIENNIENINKMFGENGPLIQNFDNSKKISQYLDTKRETFNGFFQIKERDSKLQAFFEDNSKFVFPTDYKFVDFISQLDYVTIPEYQRKYKWGNDDNTVLIRNLLDDIIKTDDKKIVLLGSVILTVERNMKSNTLKYEIIDGQQRLTTLTLIYIAMIKFADINDYDPEEFWAISIKKFDFQNQYEDESDDVHGTLTFDKICKYDFGDLLNSENVYANAYREIMYWFFQNISNQDDLIDFRNKFFDNVQFIANYNKTVDSKHQYEIFLNANTKKEELKIWEIFETNIILKALELDNEEYESLKQYNTRFSHKKVAKDKLRKLQEIIGCDKASNNDLINTTFSKFFTEYGKIIDQEYNLSSSNKIMDSLSKDLRFFLSEGKNVIEYIDHISYYFEVLSVFFDFKTNMNTKLLYVNDFVNTFCTKKSMIAFVIRILDTFSGNNYKILDFYAKTKGSFEMNREKFERINQARKVLFLLETYLISNEMDFKGLSFFKVVNNKIKFNTLQDCQIENVIHNLFPDNKLEFNEEVINNKLSNFKEKNIKNTQILLYRIAYFVSHNIDFNLIKLDIDTRSWEHWFPDPGSFQKITIEHMFSQNNVKHDSKYTKDYLENIVYDFGNLTLLGKSTNSSIKDTELYKKIILYQGNKDYNLVNYFRNDWINVVENAMEFYVNEHVNVFKRGEERNEFFQHKGNVEWTNWSKYFDLNDIKNAEFYKEYIVARRQKYIEILIKIYINSVQNLIGNTK